MSDKTQSDTDRLLDAILGHVPFDGWSEMAFRAAVAESGIDPALARAECPRGAVDLALELHERGDRDMLRRLEEADLSGLKFREKIAAAVRFRLEAIPDREVVRRAMTLFALPHLAGEGARAVWQTCDRIWTALGDTSEDANWYSKRATLSGVYSATLLFWLGDDSPGRQATWDFLDRRIDNVMQIEKLKAQVNDSALLKPLMAGPNWLAAQIRAPRRAEDLPGRMQRNR